MIPYRLRDRRRAGSRPAILVVIPYYNASAWIGECIARLAANGEPHDVLIVDDGSDVPLALPMDDNMVLCRFDRNAGLITALNFAASFALAQGYRYYVRQDADDFSGPDRLRVQREVIEREQADLVVSGVRAINEQGQELWGGQIRVDEEAFRKALVTRNPAVHSTWFMQTALFERLGCYDERYSGAEDYEFLRRIAEGGRIAIEPSEQVDYLVRSGSILSASRGPAVQTLRIILRYFEPGQLAAYVGVLRAAVAVALPRRWKTAARRLQRGLRR